LQALTLLNDPLYVESARGLAKRTMTDGGGDAASRIAFAFRTALSRPPDSVESAALLRVYERARELFRDAKADDIELAAWTTVVRTILNLDEVVTRE
jgi:hypothetical protein